MTYLGEATAGAALKLDLAAPKSGPSPRVAFLFAHNTWKPDASALASECKVKLALEVTSCPCSAMVLTQGPGGPKDKTLDCVFKGSKTPLCVPGKFLPGTKTLFTPPQEYRACHKKFPLISSWCKLAAASYEAWVKAP